MIKLILPLIPFILFAQKPNLLLLKTYKNQNITSWVMSEKLDGIRAYWDGRELHFRSGKIIHAPKWFTADYPSFEIDGELWTKRGDFENISSIVRDKIPNDAQWKSITHNIFEVPNAKGNLYKRLAKVKLYENSTIKIIPQIKIKNIQHLKQFLKEIENRDGEGVVVRDPNSPYIAKRSNKALKVKSFKDAECEVIGYTKGKGKFIGMVGAIKCKLQNGIIFKIGSGLSSQNRIKPPIIGDIITFKYKEFTKYGKPKFSSFLRVRYKQGDKE
jgi:DNA ligase-1